MYVHRQRSLTGKHRTRSYLSPCTGYAREDFVIWDCTGNDNLLPVQIDVEGADTITLGSM